MEVITSGWFTNQRGRIFLGFAETEKLILTTEVVNTLLCATKSIEICQTMESLSAISMCISSLRCHSCLSSTIWSLQYHARIVKTYSHGFLHCLNEAQYIYHGRHNKTSGKRWSYIVQLIEQKYNSPCVSLSAFVTAVTVGVWFTDSIT